MQPEWLTSTVTALARSCAPPCSHSTRSFTREIIRLWLRSLSQRSCAALAEEFGASLMAIGRLSAEFIPGPGEVDNPTLVPRFAGVNSTFARNSCQPPPLKRGASNRPRKGKRPTWQVPDRPFQFNPGGDLRSHTVARAVSSARRGLTSVFGMGTGVTLAV